MGARPAIVKWIKTCATLAQLVERLIRNQQVAGSIPAGGSINDLEPLFDGFRLSAKCGGNHETPSYLRT